MTTWDDLWARPSNMITMGVEVRTASWLEEVEKEGYLMQGKLESMQRLVIAMHKEIEDETLVHFYKRELVKVLDE